MKHNYVYVLLVEGWHEDKVYGKRWDFTEVREVFSRMKSAKSYVAKVMKDLESSASGEECSFKSHVYMDYPYEYEADATTEKKFENGLYWDVYFANYKIIRRDVK